MPLAPSDSAYLQALSRRVLVYDGAMGTNIQRHNLTAEDYGGASLEGCNDHLVLTRPEVIQGIHESFLAVGCDVVETCTFQSTPRRLEEWGLGDKVREINVAAARLARAACDAYATPEHPRFVAASIGPTGMLPSSSDPVLSQITFAELADNYYEQAKYLLEGGVDVLLVETSQDILEVKAAVAGFERLFAELGRRVAVQAQITLDTSGRMLLGTDIASAMTTLEALPIDVLGLNCSTGPEHMREPVRYLTEHATRPISVIPNAGLRSTPASARRCTRSSPRRWRRCSASSCTSTGCGSWAAAAGPRPSTCGRSWRRCGRRTRTERRRRRARGPRRSGDPPRVAPRSPASRPRCAPSPCTRTPRRCWWGAAQLAGLAQGEAAAAERRLRGAARGRARPGGRGAHVLDVCVALTERADEAEQMAGWSSCSR
jgi:5-methyltetrahydrofolate--homocysteine methyltransferase